MESLCLDYEESDFKKQIDSASSNCDFLQTRS